jgi:CrcB protein
VKIAAMKLATVAAGGALGASLRYMAAAVTHTFMGEDFPYGTMMVNVLGSLVIGYLLVGGFTTYSAFSIETLQLIQDGHMTKAGLNIVLTLALCFIAVWAGFIAGRNIHL